MKQIGFIGAGNMATAIIGGIFKSSIQARICAYDLDSAKLENLKQYNVIAANAYKDLLKDTNCLFLAVKPQNFTDVLNSIKADINPDTVVVSIAAGITAEYISKMLGFEAKIVRAMPNTPLMLSYGATALSKSEHVADEEFDFVKQIFDCAGITEVISKDKMNEIIPINGSAPAFIYKFAESFIAYGKSVGIDETVSLNLFAQSLIGSAKMMTDSGYSLEKLIEMVSSKGGTTIAGLDGLEKMRLDDAVKCCCEKCVNRAYELTLE